MATQVLLCPAIEIATNLKASILNKEAFTLDKALERIKARTNNYEVVPKVHKFYFDIDGKKLELTEEEFKARDAEVLECLKREMQEQGADARFLTASSWQARTISYRIYLQDRHGSTAANKAVAEHFKKTWKLPLGISVDTAPYAKENQKLRMLGSSKDGENRPLRKVEASDPDEVFFVSLVEAGSVEVAEPAKPKKKAVGRPKKDTTPASLIAEILAALKDARYDNYDDWLRIGMVCKAEGEPLETWVEASRRSSKFEEGICESKWDTFKRSELTLGTLWAMLEEDDPARAEQLKQGDYLEQKKEFELTHFKLENPVGQCRVVGTEIQFRTRADFSQLQENKFLRDGKPFLDRWQKDSAIRTFHKLAYAPGQPSELPNGDFNLFAGWGIEPKAGDISTWQKVLALHANGRPEVGVYLDKLIAHRFQKPLEKPKVAVWSHSVKQGTGKDTLWDTAGLVFGKRQFQNCTDVANSLLGRFNSHWSQALIVKSEEPEFDHIKNGLQTLKSLITADEITVEEKGRPRFSLDNYTLFIFTTNNAVPFPIEAYDRRNFLYEVSDERHGDTAFWKSVRTDMAKPEFLAALLHHWMNLDLTDFDPMQRPASPLMDEAKIQCSPVDARYFHHQIQLRYEIEEEIGDEILNTTAQDLTDFARREIPTFKLEKAGRLLAQQVKAGVMTQTRKLTKTYHWSPKAMLAYLRKRGWVEE